MSLRIHCFYNREARDDDARTYFDQAQAMDQKETSLKILARLYFRECD